MSKFVDLSRPITDEEREYLRSRAREGDIVANDRQFGHLKDAEKRRERKSAEEDQDSEAQLQAQIEEQYASDDEFDPDLVAQVAPLSVRELKQRIEKLGGKPNGNKDDLQIQLLDLLDPAEAPEDDAEDEDEG